MDFRYPYYFILIIGIVVGLYQFQNLTKSNKVFLLLLVITIFVELLAYFITFEKINNFIIYNSFIPLQYSLIALAFYYELNSKMILFSCLFMLIILGINIFFESITEDFFSKTLLVNFLLTIILSLFYLYELLKNDSDKNFTQFPLFWISCSLFVFCILNLFVFGTYNFIGVAKVSNLVNTIFNQIRIYSNYFLYLVFIRAFLGKQNSLIKKNEN